MYKLQPETVFGPAQCVLRTTDNCWIPLDPCNTDYQAYLLWCEQGNTPLPAENT